MKISLIIPTMKQGGAERVMSELINNWAISGNDVTLILLVKCKHFYMIHENVKIIELGFENKGKINKIKNEIKLFFTLRNLLNDLSSDFVLSFMEKYNIFTLLATRGLNQRVYISDRSNPNSKVPFMIKHLRRLTYKYADGIVAQTILAKEVLERETKNSNILVIPNPLKDVKRFVNVAREKIIINVGRLHPLKGQTNLLDIFSKANLPEWRMVFLGDGALLDDLKRKVKTLQMEKSVEFLGEVKDVDLWLAKASIFAFTSLSEGFPNALAEAMSAGVACISFDCETGPSELINNGKNGFLIPIDREELFIEKLKLLATDKYLRDSMSDEAKSINENLKIEIIAEKYLSFCLSHNKGIL